ncbi:hypothetical protein Aph01nite_21570 [Acrocarpospora phusangensis]|uniref:Uncharacterized protein n=1 Tax=Acrocarpospora phusangensis TaxID=1070424 RepID=A0A919QCM4_9ACTN|nr:hypothetical protein [Acrocarpospora phusangensis]GIH23847.1 hypothetical protein Aph01nite_21570 [Acrocarpospora phusangensis]
MSVHGVVAPGFEAVREEFAAVVAAERDPIAFDLNAPTPTDPVGFANSRGGIACSYSRRRPPNPAGAAPENTRPIPAVLGCRR